MADDDDLDALRMAALATMKRSKQETISLSASEEAIAVTMATTINQRQGAQNRNAWHQGPNLPRRRGGRGFQHTMSQRSNLIVITPVAGEEPKEEKTNQVPLLLPQHKWCQSANEESSSPKTYRKTGPTRFNRHDSDSDDSDSDYERLKDSDSSDTMCQDEPSERVSPDRSLTSGEDSSEYQNTHSDPRLHFKNITSNFKKCPTEEERGNSNAANKYTLTDDVESFPSVVKESNTQCKKLISVKTTSSLTEADRKSLRMKKFYESESVNPIPKESSYLGKSRDLASNALPKANNHNNGNDLSKSDLRSELQKGVKSRTRVPDKRTVTQKERAQSIWHQQNVTQKEGAQSFQRQPDLTQKEDAQPFEHQQNVSQKAQSFQHREQFRSRSKDRCSNKNESCDSFTNQRRSHEKSSKDNPISARDRNRSVSSDSYSSSSSEDHRRSSRRKNHPKSGRGRRGRDRRSWSAEERKKYQSSKNNRRGRSRSPHHKSHYSQSVSRSSSSSSVSSRSTPTKSGKIPTVSSVISPAKVGKPGSNVIQNSIRSCISLEPSIKSSFADSATNKTLPLQITVKSTISDVQSNVLDGNKRVPVHMRLGTFPRNRVIQMPKDVEAAFVSSGSDNEGETVVKHKKINFRLSSTTNTSRASNILRRWEGNLRNVAPEIVKGKGQRLKSRIS